MARRGWRGTAAPATAHAGPPAARRVQPGLGGPRTQPCRSPPAAATSVEQRLGRSAAWRGPADATKEHVIAGRAVLRPWSLVLRRGWDRRWIAENPRRVDEMGRNRRAVRRLSKAGVQRLRPTAGGHGGRAGSRPVREPCSSSFHRSLGSSRPAASESCLSPDGLQGQTPWSGANGPAWRETTAVTAGSVVRVSTRPVFRSCSWSCTCTCTWHVHVHEQATSLPPDLGDAWTVATGQRDG
jgi:hypothetical protein